MNRTRRGFSLIEMLVVIAVMSVMVTLGTITIALLMRSERNGGDALVAAQAANRLARQFRDDVHAAQAATLDAKDHNHPILTLQANGVDRVSWSRVEAGVRRTVAGELAGIETYRLPIGDLLFAVSETRPAGPTRRLVSVTATPPTETGPHPSDGWPVRVTAVLGPETPR